MAKIRKREKLVLSRDPMTPLQWKWTHFKAGFIAPFQQGTFLARTDDLAKRFASQESGCTGKIWKSSRWVRGNLGYTWIKESRLI